MAYFLIFFGAALEASHSLLPEIPVAVVSNTAIAAGYYISLRSIRLINNYWGFSKIDNVITCIFFVTLILLVTASNIYQTHVIAISVYIAYISIAAFIATYRSEMKISSLCDIGYNFFYVPNAIFAMLRGSTAMLDSNVRFLRFEIWDQIFLIWTMSAACYFAIGLFINGTTLITLKTQEKLLQESKLRAKLIEALEEQKNMKRIVLHELNRPLNALTARVEMFRIKSKGMSIEDVEDISRLISATNQYLQVLSDYDDIDILLDNPMIEEISISRLIHEIEIKWGIVVEIPPTIEAIKIQVDLFLFEIAISNLLENAQKYCSDRKSVAVKVELVKGSLNFDVVDDGIGIPHSEKEKVFQIFYKIDCGETNAVKGCGIGLYVVKRIAEAHNGRCEVVSQRPSTVRLKFPALLDKVENDVPQ